MFKLHDKTRRLVTLLIFLFLGPALLFVVVTKGCSRHSVKTVAGWETLLTDMFGKRVAIERVRFPTPGVVRFSQMRVFDPETNGVLLQIPQWELIERFGQMPHSIDPAWMSQADDSDCVPLPKDKASEFYVPSQVRTPYKRGLFASFGFAFSHLSGKQPRYLHCEIPKISCYETAIPQVKDVLHELAAKPPGSKTGTDLKPVVLFVGAIDVFCTDDKPGNTTSPAWNATDTASRQSQMPKPDCVTIENACFEFHPTTEQTTFLAIFQQADQPSHAKPFQLAVSCWRHPAAMTRVQFMSGDNEVPNRILANLDPFFGGFGPESRFFGNLVTEKSVNRQRNHTCALELNQAVFFNVALDSLLGKSLAFRLDGTADKIMLDSARFQGESSGAGTLRLEQAEGRMFNAKGLVSWPGLRQLVQGTKLQWFPVDASPPEADIFFRNGTFAFRIDSQGIQLDTPSNPSQQKFPLLVIDNHCNIFLPHPEYVIRYVDLLASFAQPDTQLIPLMQETQHLISTLPITVDRKTATVNPQLPPTNTPSQQPQPIQQPQSTLHQADLQPSTAFQETVPFMTPVPPLTQTVPTGAYQQQSHEQLAFGSGATVALQLQPDSSSGMPRQPAQNDSYTPAQRPLESQFFGLHQDSSHQETSALLPMQQQPTQPLPMQLQSQQSGGVPYGDNPQRLMAVRQMPGKVTIPAISGNPSRVQTDPARAAQAPFNNEMPASFDPFQQMQVASSSQVQYYDNKPATMLPATTYSVSPPPSPFGLLENNSLYNR